MSGPSATSAVDPAGSPPHAPLRIFVLWAETVAGVVLLSQVLRAGLWAFAADLGFADGDYLRSVRVSLRFDTLTGAWIATPLMFCYLASLFGGKYAGRAGRFARRYRTAAWIFTVWVFIVDLGFFNEYRDQFNAWVFGAVDDDGLAVLKTFFTTYHWGRYLAAFIASAALLIFAGRLGLAGKTSRIRFLEKISARRAGLALIPVFAVVAIGCYRGGFGRRPPEMKDAYVCRADTASRLVPNPVFLLKEVVAERIHATRENGKPGFLTDIRAQARTVFGERAATTSAISELLIHTAPGVPGGASPPRHVYLFVMESYDRWPMTPPYDAIGLTPELQKLGGAGAISENFVSGSYGTMPSLGAIITGLPFCDVPQNYQKLARRPFAGSIAAIFKKLGYKTRMAYGGFGAWQRIADFSRDQGFDEVVTGSQVPCDEADKGEWGVPDGALFAHLAALTDTDAGPTFTLVMSTSYHPPYQLDLAKFGCADATLPASLKSRYDGDNSLRVFSHLKYADAELGRMIAGVTAKHPDSLFGITGDHWSRKFLNAAPSLEERKRVPFVVYGPSYVGAGTKLAPGVHMDMAPTLLRFCAPAGFRYATFGADLFAPETITRPAALGNETLVTAEGLYLEKNPADFTGVAPDAKAATRAVEFVRSVKALSWWALMKGDELPK